MDFVLVVVGTFLLCWLADKGFQKLFRSDIRQKQGKAVRLNKLYAAAGLILVVLGISVLFSAQLADWFFLAAGCLLIVVGIGLVVYYISFGLFYDEEGFLLTTFGKKAASYRYQDIREQQLYNNAGKVAIELYLADGRTVMLQANMTDVYPFLDTAFAGWARQHGIREEACVFHDPANSCWFPPVGG